MKTIAIVSAKGGVGKTTVCANLSAALARQGRAVLTLDLDPQNALRFHMGLGPQGIDGLSRATLAGQPWLNSTIQSSSSVYVLPYGAVNEDDRQSFEQLLGQDPDAVHRHLQAMDLADDTLVLIDSPPGASVYMKQALRAADLVIVVTLPDAASYATLPTIHALINTYCIARPGFVGHAHIINQVDRSRQLANDVTALMRADLGARLAGIIHQDQSIPEALAFNRTVLDYDEHGRGTHDIITCAKWIAQKLSLEDPPT